MSRDRGSVTVWLAGLTVLVGLALAAGMAYAAAAVARHQVEAAADLAALAAATRVPDGVSAACATGRNTAGRNGGVLTACHLVGEDVVVEVVRSVTVIGLGVQRAVARARAGPVDRSGASP